MTNPVRIGNAVGTPPAFLRQHLIRCICASQTYQRTSIPLKGNVEDRTRYSHQGLKLMTAEVLLEKEPEPRRGVRRPDQGPEGPRPARKHADHLDG